jgi:thiol-disulfide isomerase/thioredoxin
MKKLKVGLPIIVTAMVFLSACSPAVTATPEVMMDKPTEEMMDKPTEAMMEKTAEPMMDETKPADVSVPLTPDDTMMENMPTWFSAKLTDVNTGNEFSISDYKGQVVVVETLAMWCSNCKKQQGEVLKLKQELGDHVVFVGLDIDPNENMEKLKEYTTANGFDWVYSVASAEISNELASLYGNQFLNPPSTPMLIIDAKGEVHTLPFGIKSAEQLKEFVTPFLEM